MKCMEYFRILRNNMECFWNKKDYMGIDLMNCI
jgi:hypothetical protein